MGSWIAFAGVLVILLVALASRRSQRLSPDPAALDLIRGMSDDDQRHFQNLATTKGKIEAIKALRARTPVGLKVGKDTIELLQAVRPAVLKFD